MATKLELEEALSDLVDLVEEFDDCGDPWPELVRARKLLGRTPTVTEKP